MLVADGFHVVVQGEWLGGAHHVDLGQILRQIAKARRSMYGFEISRTESTPELADSSGEKAVLSL